MFSGSWLKGGRGKKPLPPLLTQSSPPPKLAKSCTADISVTLNNLLNLFYPQISPSLKSLVLPLVHLLFKGSICMLLAFDRSLNQILTEPSANIFWVKIAYSKAVCSDAEGLSS